MIGVRVSDELLEAIDSLAHKTGRTRSAVCREILVTAVDSDIIRRRTARRLEETRERA